MRWSVGSCCLCWSLACAPLIGQAEAGTAGLPTAKPAPLARGALVAEQAPELSRRAEQHRSRGEYARAELLWQRVLTIQEQALGSEHPDVATTLYNLASLAQERGGYPRAETLWRRALGIYERALGPEHLHVAATLHGLASLYLTTGEYDRIEPLLRRTLAIEEKILGAEHPYVATTLHSLAYLFQVQGEYARATSLFQRALGIEEQAFGLEHPAVAATLHSLAAVYLATGDYTQAESFFQRARTTRERTEGPEHPHVATTLDSLAGLYVATGDYARAEPLFRRALAIWEKNVGLDHPNAATTLNNLAELYREKKDYERAGPLFRQALAIWEKALGPEHPTVATVLHNLATLYREQGKREQAEPLFRQALAIWQRRLGSDHPNVATALHNLATLYREQGDYARAGPLFQQALALREKMLGPKHPTVATTLHGLALLHAAQGNAAGAVAWQARCNEIREHNLALFLATGSEAEKRAYLATVTEETDFTLSLHLRFAPRDQQAARLALTTVLRRKGRVLDALTASLATVRRHLSADDQAVLGRLAAVRAQLATRVLQGPGSLVPQQHRARIGELEADAQQLEARLSARSAAFRVQSLPVTIAEVQQRLPPEAALVEFVLYRPFHLTGHDHTDRWEAPRYGAYVLHGAGDPAWVDLGDATAINQTLTRVRRALSDPASTDVRSLARTLDEQVMRPVRPFLGANSLILLSPDGQLNLLPFGVLVDENQHYLIERFTFITLTTGRDLLRHTAQRPTLRAPVIVAYPDFDGQRGAAVLSLAHAGPREGARRAGAWFELRFAPLTGTVGEATALTRLLPAALVLTEAAATEAALKQFHGPRILHIATHGFFLAGPSEEGLTQLGFVELQPASNSQSPAPLQAENPLVRSGLALAGANQLAGEEDGILTALEAAGLDLWGTWLVVLSACETGVGDVQNGEGVSGLRRAITIAGAESQVMSLWKVGDRATRDLMAAYYARLILGAGRAAGLRQVQLQMLASPRWGHPFYWASFIHSGEWTPIGELRPELSVQGIMRTFYAWFYR